MGRDERHFLRFLMAASCAKGTNGGLYVFRGGGKQG